MSQYPEPLMLNKLDASPGITAVSEMAKGDSNVDNQQQEDEKLQHKPGERMGQCQEECCRPTSQEIMEAYSKLFEGLAVISRGNSHN